MARRELYARIEPKYLTTCNMTVKVSLASSDFLVFMESFLAVVFPKIWKLEAYTMA